MNKRIVVLNHKDYLQYDKVKDYILKIKDKLRTDYNIIICPSNILIPYFIGKYSFNLGVQNISYKIITGEITPVTIKDMNVKYSLVGHPERRYLLKEDDMEINNKIKALLSADIIPILCVGETYEQKLRKKSAEVVLNQIKRALIDIDDVSNLIIAYEPVYSIGSSDLVNEKDIEEIVGLIKLNILRVYNTEIKVLYGGGINEKNLGILERINNIDGYMIGKISVIPKEILTLLNSMK